MHQMKLLIKKKKKIIKDIIDPTPENQFSKQHPKKIFQIFLNKLFQKQNFLLMLMNLMNIKSLKP